jgi:CubicO group peptidase (beta-lactamase class C family)
VPPLVDDLSIVGLSLGVIADQRLVGTCNHGLADVRSKRPADTDTVYRVGSITKTFTGIAAMQLVEQG